MLQKFNITTYAVALCLFGFMIFSAAPVFANDEAQGEFEDCKDMKWKDGPQEKKDCFKELAKSLINNDSGGQTNSSGSSTDEPFSEELCDAVVKVKAVMKGQGLFHHEIDLISSYFGDEYGCTGSWFD